MSTYVIDLNYCYLVVGEFSSSRVPVCCLVDIVNAVYSFLMSLCLGCVVNLKLTTVKQKLLLRCHVLLIPRTPTPNREISEISRRWRAW